MIYSRAPSERIDTGKTWPVYTVRLRALGRRACIWHIVQFIVHSLHPSERIHVARSKVRLGASFLGNQSL